MISISRLEPASSHADEEKKLETEESDSNLEHPEKTTTKYLQHHMSRKKRRAQHELTHCPHQAWCEICVGATCADRHHNRQKFDYRFGANRLRQAEGRVVIMVVTGSVNFGA